MSEFEQGLLILVGLIVGAVIVARMITASVHQSMTKPCPQCAERVKNAARKCPHCGHLWSADPL